MGAPAPTGQRGGATQRKLARWLRPPRHQGGATDTRQPLASSTPPSGGGRTALPSPHPPSPPELAPTNDLSPTGGLFRGRPRCEIMAAVAAVGGQTMLIK